MEEKRIPRASANNQISALDTDRIRKALEGTGSSMRGIVICQKGKVTLDHWWSPYTRNDRFWVYSVSKSFTSTAIGFAVSDGLLSPDDKVISFFPDRKINKEDENLTSMTVQDLLTMRSGHFEDTLPRVFQSGTDWVQTFLSLPVEKKPGTFFVYNTGASYMLAAIAEKVTGQGLLAYLTSRLFTPLGITNVSWDCCPMGIAVGGWGLSIGTEDMAKLGLLYLNKGCYEGHRILPEEWVLDAVSPHADNNTASGSVDWRQGYGYQFWRNSVSGYRADGACGQYILVLPEADAVIAINSETTDMQKILNVVWEIIFPLLCKPEIHPNGVYVLTKNADNLTQAGIQINDDHLCFSLWDDQNEYKLLCGRENWVINETGFPLVKFAFTPRISQNDDLKIAARYSCANNQLEIELAFLGAVHTQQIQCSFHENQVTIRVNPSLSQIMGEKPPFGILKSIFWGEKG